MSTPKSLYPPKSARKLLTLKSLQIANFQPPKWPSNLPATNIPEYLPLIMKGMQATLAMIVSRA